MNILFKDIHNLLFNDIDAFCLEKQIEGIQLEYKKDFPQKGLARQFASMSNTRGGLIIIGIEEDEKTGLPKVWSGLKNEGKLIDRVHQYATLVEPLPDYQACVTNEINGNVFILIRVFEGNQTPYYVFNDANIWVRTGNLSNPIDIASSDALELLFKKKERAALARSINLERAEELFTAALNRAEKERIIQIAVEKETFEKEQRLSVIGKPDFKQFKPSCIQSELGSNVSLCSILLQPFYPQKAFIKPFDLKSNASKFQIKDNFGREFPDFSQETTPNGILHFRCKKSTGEINCEQVFCNGLLSNIRDILRIEQNETRQIYIALIGDLFISTLLLARNYYNIIGYQGGINGYIKIQGLMDAYVHQIRPKAFSMFFPDPKKVLLSEYCLIINLDTAVLNKNDDLIEFFIEKMNDLYVSLDFAPQLPTLFNSFLKESGWLSTIQIAQP